MAWLGGRAGQKDQDLGEDQTRRVGIEGSLAIPHNGHERVDRMTLDLLSLVTKFIDDQ